MKGGLLISAAIIVMWSILAVFFNPSQPTKDILSNFSLYADIISLALLFPILLYQINKDTKAQEEQLKSFHEIQMKELRQLRKVETNEALKKLTDAINSKNTKTKIIYVSKYSAIPGFWLHGGDWLTKNITNNIENSDYLVFAGPCVESKCFESIATKILSILKDTTHQKCDDIKLHFPTDDDINDIKRHYLSTCEVMERKGAKVVHLNDTQLNAVSFNFSMIKDEKRTNNHLFSPWEIYFFDSESVFDGNKRKTEMDIMEILTEPEIFSSSNEALGNMMYYHALMINNDIDSSETQNV